MKDCCYKYVSSIGCKDAGEEYVQETRKCTECSKAWLVLFKGIYVLGEEKPIDYEVIDFKEIQ